MSLFRTLADKLKALPSALGNESGVVVFDNNGLPYNKPVIEFGTLKRTTLYPGEVLKIIFPTSVLVSLRGPNSSRCALVWISSYGDGTFIRTNAKAIRNDSEYYSWFVNGTSESSAIYLKVLGTSGYDEVSVLSIFSNIPMIEKVSSVPSDAAILNLDS